MICNGNSLFWTSASMIFHSCCLACCVIGGVSIMFMYKLNAASLCSRGWLEQYRMVTSVSVGFL